MTMRRKIIEIDEALCNGCGQCITGCAEGALELVDGKAKLVAERYCDGLGACIGECPTGALTIVERDADAFDEEAVEKLLAERERQARSAPQAPPAGIAPGGCPSAGLRTLSPCRQTDAPTASVQGETPSALGHWPVQLRLVPPHAPFLKDAHLLVAADCVPVALPDFHARYVPGKVVLLGCPKFDDARDYVERLADILRRGDIAGVTVLEMEVPCCQSFDHILNQARRAAGTDTPITKVVVSREGRVLAEGPLHAPGAAPEAGSRRCPACG